VPNAHDESDRKWRLHDELLLYIDFSRNVCYIVHTECVAQGVCEVNLSEQSIHNSNASCNLFTQSNKVKSIYSTVFCI